MPPGQPETPSLDAVIAAVEDIVDDLQTQSGLSPEQHAKLTALMTQLKSIQSHIDSLMHGG